MFETNNPTIDNNILYIKEKEIRPSLNLIQIVKKK